MFEKVPEREKAVLQSKTFKRIADYYQLQNKRVLDLGCGYGEYMQRFGQNSIGITTTPEEVEYGKRINRDIRLGNIEQLADHLSTTEKFDFIWCNNILEHLLSPHAFLVKLKRFADSNTKLIIGTPMVPYVPQLMNLPKMSGALASPHINFFTKKTYRLTAEFAGWSVESTRPFLFSNKILDESVNNLMPHLYLIAENNASYKYPPKKLHEWEHDEAFKELLAIMG